MEGLNRALFTAALWLFASCAYASGGVSLVLTHEGRDSSAPNTVAITLSNGTERDVFIYGYESAFAQPQGRTTSNWFRIKDSFDKDVPYKGRYVVSGAPPPSQFTRIRPGEHLDTTVDLSREYELPPAGSITVKTSVAVYDRIPTILPTGESEAVPYESIESNAATFAVVRTVGLVGSELMQQRSHARLIVCQLGRIRTGTPLAAGVFESTSWYQSGTSGFISG